MWIFLGLLLVTSALRAGDSLVQARRAQALLGPELWSRVIRIENESSFSAYSRVVHALVFELDGVLWFYTEADGTQSLSLQRGRLDADQADFGPLLREIDPGFSRWREVPPAAGSASPVAPGKLRNGCFIASVAVLRERLASGSIAVRPQLLAFYSDTSKGMLGHTVLVTETGGRVEVFDPDWRGAPRFLSARLLKEPLALAREIAGEQVAKARLVAITPPAAWTQMFASAADIGSEADSPLHAVRTML